MHPLLSVDDALAKILAASPGPLPSVNRKLSRALGRALAAAVVCDRDSPPHDKATVDGYAIVAADLAAGSAEFQVIEEVMAGQVPAKPLSPGLASRVMTGAPLPPGADAMVMLEDSESLAGGPTPRVRLRPSIVKAGQNILRRGASMRRGDTALRPGVRLRPIEIGLLAELGRTEVCVRQRPRVAILATGDELVGTEETPAAGQIRDSNGPLLQALVERAGSAPQNLGIAPDQPEALAARIRRGLECDLLLVSGGVSAGDLDLVPEMLRAAGVERILHGVRVKPGKPLWFGVHRGLNAGGREHVRPVFGLPGNAVSALVCFELFARPVIERMLGLPPVGPRRAMATLSQSFAHRGDRPTYYPGLLGEPLIAGDGQLPAVTPLAWRGSGDLRALSGADALIVFPAGDREHEAGANVETLCLE